MSTARDQADETPEGDESDEKWKNLGSDPDQVRKVSEEELQRIKEAATSELKQISIRLNEDLIERLKYLAARDGIGYQTLARQILNRAVAERLEQ